ncbi:MAG: FGGY-family carbohydrate kinase [Planctomycetota bacterium]|jgi:xylulokinase
MDYLLGIDVGSTNLKAIIYDLTGNSVSQGLRPTQRFNPYPEHPDWAIWKPEQIWGDIAASIKEAVSRIESPGDIKALAVTGMGMDGVPIAKDGSWLYPFISWHCPRTEPQQRWWLENVGSAKQFGLCGNQIWVFNTALRLLWMRENEPKVLAKTEKWLLIEDFVNFMLCGEYATDYSMASTTLLFDQRKRTWCDELLEMSRVDRGLLCEPQPAGTVIGQVHKKASEATGLAEGTAVVLGGHDYCCGALPTGAFNPGVVLDVTGTWEMVVASLTGPVLTGEVQEMGILVDSHVARGKWTAMGAAVAGDMLEWFLGEYGTEEKRRAETEGGVAWDYLMEAAGQRPAGANGVMFLPHMSGSHCPVVDHKSMGAFVGLRNIVTKADMLRAVIEGLDYQFLQMVQGFETGLGIDPEKIVAIGGAVNNEFWMQNKADVVGKPIETPELAEAVVLGAAILAGIGVGLYEGERDAFDQVYRPGRTYEPKSEMNEQYAERFKVFQQLYPALKELNGQLYEVSCASVPR